mmetsp:Transcript_31310/g.71611  ORF Transcript_31310/g.71611 Transcript_31310/m.71611 type:complete len:201 (-) Transcript_31310:4435-5037(-)
MSFNNSFELCLSFISFDTLHLYNFLVQLLFKVSNFIVKIAQSPSHTCSNITPNRPQYNSHTPSHIFQTMISCTLYSCKCSRVTHAKTFACTPICMKVPSSCSIKASITNYTRVLRSKLNTFYRNYSDFTTMHPLANIIISFTNKTQIHTRQRKGTKRLTCTTCECNINLSSKVTVTMLPCNISRKHGTSGAISIVDFHCN